MLKEAIEKIQAMSSAAQPVKAEGPFRLVPDGYAIHPFEQYQAAPDHVRAAIIVQDVAAFVDYLNKYKTADTAIFVDIVKASVWAIIDFHEAGQAHWCRHRVDLLLEFDRDFELWRANDTEMMGQAEFAAFIEDNLPSIRKPDGADLLELVQDLEATMGVVFKSAQRLEDGQRKLHYEENITKKLSKGSVTFPNLMTIGVPVFKLGDVREIEVRLRHRVNNGQLGLYYQLVRPEDAIQEAMRDIHDAIEGGVADVLLLRGPGGQVQTNR